MLFLPTVTTELKKGSFKAERKNPEAPSFHQNKGETRTQQHQPLRKRKAQPHGHLAAPLASVAHQRLRHCHLPARPCHAKQDGQPCWDGLGAVFFLPGKGMQGPPPRLRGSRSPDNLIVGFLFGNPRVLPI